MTNTNNNNEFKEVISSMYQNKGIGMTENQWNDIVKRNMQKEMQETRQKEFTLQAQKIQLRNDLMR